MPLTAATAPIRTRQVRHAVVLALLAAIAVVSGIAGASPASAHAALEGGSVRDGEVLDVAPQEVFLTFNEPVVSGPSGVRVYDGDGERVDVGGTFQEATDPARVRVALRDGLGEGTYAVTYRVVSADSHPVAGALLFSIGAEAGDGDALLTAVFTTGGDRGWAILAAIARWALYAAVLLAGGGALVAWWLRREVAPELPWVKRQVGRAALVVIGASGLGVVLQTILVVGDGVGSLADPAGLPGTLTSSYGVSAGVAVVAALGLLLVARSQGLGTPLSLAPGGALLLSVLLTGHTLTTGPAAVVWPAAVVHVLTTALWAAGLVVLAKVLRDRRRADDPIGAGRLVARFSSMFTVSVVAVVAAGSALSWVEVRALRAVLSTDYGLVLLAKVAVVLPLLALGLYNNRKLVPVLTARRSRQRAGTATPAIAGGSDEVSAAARSRDGAWDHLRRTVRIEVALVAVVLGITGVLVSLQPAAVAAGITGAFSTNVALDDVGQLSITVDPNRSGRNEIHMYLLGDTGRPSEIDDGVTMRLSQPDLDIGPIEREPFLAGPGHFILSGPELSVPGRWTIDVEVALNRFDTTTTTVEVVVNP